MINEDVERELEDIMELLKVLSGRNCLKILQALSKPKYWSQLMEELNIHRWVLKKYIDKLLQCGLIDSFIKPVKRGPPRRYFQITRNLTLLLEISPKGVRMHQLTVPHVKKNFEIIARYPSIKKIAEEARKVSQVSDPFERKKFIEDLRKQIEDELFMLSATIDFLQELLRRLRNYG